MIEIQKCPGGEIGRRTGLKILGFVNTGVPVQVRPGAPLLSNLLKINTKMKNQNQKKIGINKKTVDENPEIGRYVYSLAAAREAKILTSEIKKLYPSTKSSEIYSKLLREITDENNEELFCKMVGH